jgi:hypothetical protein
MKYRAGFVTNSSSASFVCSFCGFKKEGYDWDPPEVYGFYACVNGHMVCEAHLGEEAMAVITAVKTVSQNEDEEYILTEKQCPVCAEESLNKFNGGIFGTGHNTYPEKE